MAGKKVTTTFGQRIRCVVEEPLRGDVEAYAKVIGISRRTAFYWLDRAEPPARGLASIKQRHESLLGVSGPWIESGSGSMWLPRAAGVAPVAATLRQYPEIAKELTPELEMRVQMLKARDEEVETIVRGLLRNGWSDSAIENHIQQMSRFEGVNLGQIRAAMTACRKQMRHKAAANRAQAQLRPRQVVAPIEAEAGADRDAHPDSLSRDQVAAFGGLI